MIDNVSKKRRTPFEILLWMLWSSTILMKYVRAVVLRVPVIGDFPDVVMTICFVIAIIFAIQDFRISSKDVLFVLVLYLVFIFECLMRGQNNIYLEKYYFEFPFKTVLLYLVGVSLAMSAKKEEIINHLYIISMITLPVCFAYNMLLVSPMDEIVSKYQGNMDLAYHLLPHCCLIAYYARKKPNILNIAFTVFGAFYLMLLGTRGAALMMLLCIGWSLVLGQNSKKVFTRIVVLCGAVAAFIMSPLYDSFILWMYKMAQSLGLSIRIFDKLLSSGQMDSSGRSVLAETLLASVNEHFLLGTGLCSDRTIVGVYAHNIALELWVEFGVIIGTFILAALVITFLRGYIVSTSSAEKGLMITLICSSFLKLFLSGSFMDERWFFALIGICVGAIRLNGNKNCKEEKKAVEGELCYANCPN